jgi:hypothetical protein
MGQQPPSKHLHGATMVRVAAMHPHATVQARKPRSGGKLPAHCTACLLHAQALSSCQPLQGRPSTATSQNHTDVPAAQDSGKKPWRQAGRGWGTLGGAHPWSWAWAASKSNTPLDPWPSNTAAGQQSYLLPNPSAISLCLLSLLCQLPEHSHHCPQPGLPQCPQPGLPQCPALAHCLPSCPQPPSG